MTGSERNASQRHCTKMKRALERNQARTKRERNANEGVFKEMKGAEAAVKWKEVKGHARKLRGKGDERTGRGARWPAVSRSV